jgi:hypothetical protein
VLSDIAKEIPQEGWDKLPEDLDKNLDHYLYGGPKKMWARVKFQDRRRKFNG